MQISRNSCIQRNRLIQQRTSSYTTFGATGGFGSSGERCKSRCNRGVDQVHISRSGADQKIRCRSGRGASVRKQTMCGTSGICHYIQTVSYTGQLFPSHDPVIVIIIKFRNPENLESGCWTWWTKRFPGDETDRLWIINGSIDHFLFLMALDRFERESIKYAKKCA